MKERGGFRKRVYEVWLSFTLKQKIATFAGSTIAAVLLSLVFNMVVLDFSLYGFKNVLDDNGSSYEFMEAMAKESAAFEAYVRNRVPEREKEYQEACQAAERALRALPYDFETMGTYRMAKTWSIKNSYESYRKQKDYILKLQEERSNYITELYRTYRMQEYLQEYARVLVQYTLQEGNEMYQDRVPVLSKLPLLNVAFCFLLAAAVLWLGQAVNQTLILPVVRLAHASRKIAVNDYGSEDVVVPNKDEIGELARAFNKMKHATERYIATLEEKREMAELLHKEEVEKLEVEKRLDETNLELLKSQINPHFLFNTLNMIACMAKLEDAGTTEQMTNALSSLFRYNLKTPEAVVILEQELKVVKDYMYIQQMRFGSRIHYDIDCQVDGKSVMVPTFTFQPLVENAIIHGLSKKEAGGKIYIRIWEKQGFLYITVADTGVGMPEQRLENLREALKWRSTSNVGIGVGNIYKRIYSMYGAGDFQIYSKEGCGTVVKIMIPQNER